MLPAAAGSWNYATTPVECCDVRCFLHCMTFGLFMRACVRRPDPVFVCSSIYVQCLRFIHIYTHQVYVCLFLSEWACVFGRLEHGAASPHSRPAPCGSHHLPVAPYRGSLPVRTTQPVVEEGRWTEELGSSLFFSSVFSFSSWNVFVYSEKSINKSVKDKKEVKKCSRAPRPRLSLLSPAYVIT